MMKINHAIRYLRRQRGWTQQQLADLAHTSKSNIANLENGNQGYSPAILQYLSEAFGLPVSKIFLLAENLDEQGRLVQTDTPIELLFLQLPDETRHCFRKLIEQFLNTQKNG